MNIIAFYLPQFHTFPENDNWWGKGFTEWTNTKKSKPLFSGHYQPHVPYDNYYYDLLDNSTFERQIELAKKYGVYGFCFYHYWFGNGKLLLHKPLENFLNDKTLNIKFCLSWANEHWTRRWDGGDKKILMEQNYGDSNDWNKHFEYLLNFFKDDRYIKIDGMPLLIIYRPELIDDIKPMIELWKKLSIDSGFNGLKVFVQSSEYCNKLLYNNKPKYFDGYIMYEPGFTLSSFSIKNGVKSLFRNISIYPELFFRSFFVKVLTKIVNIFDLNIKKPTHIYDYSVVSRAIIRHIYDDMYYPGMFTGWDNSPRRGAHGRIIVNSTPNLFYKFMSIIIKNTRNIFNKDYIFITAWNEWGEGAHLEPDSKFGFEYLEGLKKALEDNNEFPRL